MKNVNLMIKLIFFRIENGKIVEPCGNAKHVPFEEKQITSGKL